MLKGFGRRLGKLQICGSQALGYFQMGLDVVKSKKLVKDLMFNISKDLSEAFDRAEGFIIVKEAMNSLKPSTTEKSKDWDMNNYSKNNN